MPAQSLPLAAIMFTDIVGYTALMGANSKKALELVHTSKEIQNRWLKSTRVNGSKKWEMVPWPSLVPRGMT